MIRIKKLTVSFAEKVVLNDINMEISTGGFVVILGKNGAGKSVFLKVIAGLIERYDGEVEIDNVNIKDFYRDRISGSGRGTDGYSLAYVFQRGGLFDSMNVYDNVAFGLRRRGIDEAHIGDRVLESLSRVGLSGNEYKLPSELSGGMQKRVGLARAICLNPDIVLYDDPTAGLDPILSDSIADLMIEINETLNATSIVSTHDLKVARKIGDSIALLYDGRLVFWGSGESFFQAQDPFARQFIEGDTVGPIDLF
jgi:phospholipid/cholesterol/gamma-HCH transport system ATP-binding protein